MKKTRPSITPEMLRYYEKMAENFSSRGMERKKVLKEETDYLG